MAQLTLDLSVTPNALKFDKPATEVDRISSGQPISRTIYNGRYFYRFAEFLDQWTFFVFDSYFRQSFEMYNAMELTKYFPTMEFKYVPYDARSGLVYTQLVIVKIELDDDFKKVTVIGDEFRLPLEPDFPYTFFIHFIEILQNDVVFIYTVRRENNVSQRAYLQEWNDITKRINMCKIGIRDAGGKLLFVNATIMDDNKICLVHMQDKTRLHGSLAPLVLYWSDIRDKVDASKFEKVENVDGKPYTTAIKGRLNQKHYSGAWHGHFFTMMISKATTMRATKFTSFLFIYDGLAKTWMHLKTPSSIHPARNPLLAFTNGGNHESQPLIFYSSNSNLPNQVYRMPVRRPEKLMRLAILSAAYHGMFNAREKINISRMELQMQVDKREEHKRLIKEHQKLAREHALKAKKLEKELKELKKKDLSSNILPITISMPSPQSDY